MADNGSWKNYQLFQKFKSWWSSRDCLLSKLIIILIESLMIPKKKNLLESQDNLRKTWVTSQNPKSCAKSSYLTHWISIASWNSLQLTKKNIVYFLKTKKKKQWRKIVVEALRQLTTINNCNENGEQSAESATESVAETTAESLSEAVTESKTVNTDCVFRTPVTTCVDTSPVASTSTCSNDAPASGGGSSLSSANQMTVSSNTDLANSSYVKDFSRLIVVKMMNGDADNSLNDESGKSSLCVVLLLFETVVDCFHLPVDIPVNANCNSVSFG